MVDIASLAIQIDTSDVARAESDLAKLNGAGTKAEKAAKGVEGAFTGAAKAAGVYRDAAGRLREANGKLVSEARKVELGLKGIGDQAKKTGAEFNGLSNVAGKVGASIVAALSVREVYQATEAYTSISNRLRLVTDSAGAFAAAQAAVFRVAQEGRQPLTETAELYQRIATNQKQLGLTGEGVARVTETISKSLAVSGASAATAAGALTQLGQAFASGTLRGEELNSVLEGAPALAQTLARGLNVTVGELRNLGAEGKLTAEQVVGALLSQSEAMDKAFEKLAPNISGALTTVGNSFTQLIGKMDETSGASSDTASAIMDVAEILSDPATVEAAQTFGRGIATAIGWIAEASTATVGTVKWMAEELAATLHGAASDDIVRLQDQLETFQAMQDNPLRRLRIGGDGQPLKLFSGEEIQQNIDILKRMIGEYYALGDAATKVGDTASSAAPKIEAFRTGTASLGTAAAEAAGKTDKQATAFKSLMDGLFPAEAAQRKYNEQVALLDKYLDGDQLAKAVQRLNESLYAGDATGPGDAIEDYRKELERLKDDLDPVGVATRKYTKDQDKLNEMLSRGMVSAGEHGEMMAELGKRYKENTQETSQWAEWTESALERVDGAFADAWRNIGDGFKGFADSLKNAFAQMLAELAHMAITRPIVMQIGAALGIGGGSAGAGLLSLGGGAGGSGGSLLADAWQYGSSLYSTVTSGFGQAVMAGWNSGTGLLGGLQGAAAGGWNYGSTALGGMFSGGSAAAGTAAGYGLGQPLVTGTAGSASYAASSGIWGSGVSGTAAGLYGVGGALYGYGQSGWKGAATGALGGVGGGIAGGLAGVAAAEALGMAAGSILGPLGAALGAAIGGWIGGSLFGGDWQQKSSGIAVNAKAGEFDGRNYKYFEKKGGLFGSDKDKYEYSEMDATLEKALSKRFESVTEGAVELFEKLGYDVAEGALDALSAKTKHIRSDTKKAQEKIQERLDAWFGKVGDTAVQSINDQLSAGLESYTFASLAELVTKLEAVNATFETLNIGIYESSVAGAKLAEDMVALAGGLDAFQQATAAYYDKFFTAGEKAEDTVQAVIAQFAEMDQALPATRQQYRELVESIDVSTEAGRELVTTLMSLASAADSAYTALDALRAGNQAMADAARANVIAAYQREGSALQATISKFDAFSSSLAAFREQLSLTILATQSPTTQIEALRKQFQLTASRAKLGDESAMGELPAVGANLATASLAFAASREDYIRELAGIQSATYDAEQTAGRQSSIAQQQLDALTEQLDALGLIHGSVQTLAEAIAALAEAQAAAKTAEMTFFVDSIMKGFEALKPTQVVSALGMGFETLDENVDSLLDQAELKEALKGKASDEQLKALGFVVDTNFDGLISATEMAAAASMTQAQAITSGLAGIQQAIGGAISLAQAQAGLGSIAGGKDIAGQFGNLDLDKDGALSAGEIAGTATPPAKTSLELSKSDALSLAKANGIKTGGADSAAGYQKIIDQLADKLDTQISAGSKSGKAYVAGFARGGFHNGGLRLVGEEGPELEVTGPSRIYSASQTAAMLGGGGDAAKEVRAMRADFGGMISALRSVAKHTMQTAKRVEFLERWDFDGLPKERATA